MGTWEPTPEQKAQYAEQGYLIVRGVLSHDTAMEIRGIIKDTILRPEPGVKADPDPMDPMGDTPAARAARFRKLSGLGLHSPLVWYTVYAGETTLPIARYFLGDDILVKYMSCFLKPARTGSATPWHQDNGLWRDGETEPCNMWIALDPATRANGCLQFIPGSHRTEIIPHVLYPDSIHGELPRELVREMIARYGVHYIELDPGDAVVWHSSLWHYSPPNTSDQSRIAIAAVWTSKAVADRSCYFRRLYWAMKDGVRCAAFPPEEYIVGEGRPASPPPFPRASA
jgi:ectoine hydroxylase-related dioxygenase (phytanoyl-CoA dioxygenase family)